MDWRAGLKDMGTTCRELNSHSAADQTLRIPMIRFPGAEKQRVYKRGRGMCGRSLRSSVASAPVDKYCDDDVKSCLK